MIDELDELKYICIGISYFHCQYISYQNIGYFACRCTFRNNALSTFHKDLYQLILYCCITTRYCLDVT